jgi:hypothetical protein
MENENKYVFAVYANLATGYFLNCLNVIAKRAEATSLERWKKPDIKCHLCNIFDKSKPINDLEKIVEGFFPWITPLLEKVGFDKDNRQADELNDAYRAILTAFSEQLDDIRNHYTHYHNRPIEQTSFSVKENKNYPISYCVNDIYDGAVNLVKKRFEADEREVEHLRRYKSVAKKGILRTE